ncbi:MAG: hypothetical protein AB1324_06150 [Candidatus Micrarchaeota archaeon]
MAPEPEGAEEKMICGYRVLISRADDVFVASVPELPGCSVHHGDKRELPRLVETAISDYLAELAKKRPAARKGQDDPEPHSRIEARRPAPKR